MNTWIPVRHFPAEQDLRPLVAFLQARGLAHRISEDQGQQLLAVGDASVIPALNEFLDQFQQGEVELPPVVELPHNPHNAVPALLWLRLVPVVCLLVLFSVLGWFIASTALGSPWQHWFTFQDYTHNRFIPLGDSLAKGEYWRLLSPIFLHFGAVHLLFNMAMLWWFGQRLELLFGHVQFVLFVVLVGVAANLGQFYWTGLPNFGGMSGVIYGFVGYVLLAQRLMPHPLLNIPGSMLWFMLAWLVFAMTGVVDLFMEGGIANANHLAGLLAGMAYAVFGALVHKLFGFRHQRQR